MRLTVHYMNKKRLIVTGKDFKEMEARVGIEPTIEDLQSSALPLGDRAISNQCG